MIFAGKLTEENKKFLDFYHQETINIHTLLHTLSPTHYHGNENTQKSRIL